VILDRAAAVVLGKARGFHVRLDGPAERRIAQGAAIEGISEDQARERLRAADKARTAYVRGLYRCDPDDASPVPPGDRLHRGTAGHRYRAHPGRGPHP
jgi:Cytidylate kinase-like family